MKAHERLAAEMFRDRADQFKIRLNWEVNVDAHGFERDEYNDLNPLYVIWENADGTHVGSMRFLPTVGRVMVNDHFSHLLGGRPNFQFNDLGMHPILFVSGRKSKSCSSADACRWRDYGRVRR